jgi:hypothetical protein
VKWRALGRPAGRLYTARVLSLAWPRFAGALALTFVGFSVGGCGESAQEKATAEVCAARGDISKQVSTLSGLTISTASVSKVSSSIETIANDVKKIKAAQENLDPSRKQQVEGATQAFSSELASIASGLASNLSLSNAEAQLESAVSKLTSSYKKTLEPIHCS